MATITTELTVAEAAREAGVTAHTLRYYDRAGLLARVERNGAGHRRFTAEDIDWVVMVTRLRATGMPIRAIRQYAELVREGEGNEAQRLALLEAHRERVLEQLADIRRNLELVDYKIGLYRERTSTAAR
jgi:DNA-binding transcriptional MerR regulator